MFSFYQESITTPDNAHKMVVKNLYARVQITHSATTAKQSMKISTTQQPVEIICELEFPDVIAYAS